jgi:hypothetical protein
MIYDEHGQHTVTRQLTTLGFLTLLLVSGTVSLQEIEDETFIVPPEDWYQVEVILFTHDVADSGELPPKDYELNFPDNLLRLIDVKALAEQDALAIEGALTPDTDDLPLEDSFPFIGMIPTIEMQDPAIGAVIFDREMVSSLDNSAALLDLTTPPLESYIAEYEQPFELLDNSERDLNDSARVLDQRQYNVIFHEAWRFVAEENSQDPWLLISSGKKIDNRAEVEGGIRFYKARFLHFETNLWRLKFANQASFQSNNLVELPDVPMAIAARKPNSSWRIVLANENGDQQVLAEDTTLKLNNFNSNSVNGMVVADVLNIAPVLAYDDMADANSPSPTQPTQADNSPLDIDGLSYVLEQFDANLGDLQEQQTESKQYAVTAVWPINQSKRIEEEKVYYLDHPELGIMLTIKRYEPRPINPQPSDRNDSALSLTESP